MALDEDALRRLGEQVGTELLPDLIDDFVIDARRLADELAGAVGGGDAESAERAAHTLKSTAMMFGAAGLADACRRGEELARAGASRASLVRSLRAVRSELDAVVPALERYGTSERHRSPR